MFTLLVDNPQRAKGVGHGYFQGGGGGKGEGYIYEGMEEGFRVLT